MAPSAAYRGHWRAVGEESRRGGTELSAVANGRSSVDAPSPGGAAAGRHAVGEPRVTAFANAAREFGAGRRGG